MIYLIISLTSFIITVLIHILLYRILARWGLASFKSIFIFLLGLALTSFFIISFYFSQILSSQFKTVATIPLPISSIVLYILLAVVFSMFFTSPYLEEVSPSTKILSLVRKHKRLTLEEIQARFTNQELIVKRLNSLVRAGFIARGKTYQIRPYGQRLVKLLNMYRRLFGWEFGG